MQRCLSDQAGIAEAEKKNVEFRAAARAAAAAATNTGEKPDRNAAQEPRGAPFPACCCLRLR